MKTRFTFPIFLSTMLLVFSHGALSQSYRYVDLSFPVASGDVVARDLKIVGLGWLGHVGIIDSLTAKVLEVLNESSVVYMKNSMNQFIKSARVTGYWGTRFERNAGQQEVITEGWWQRIFNPRYTTSASWTEGKWLPVRNAAGVQTGWKKQAAKFRCDTFVAYSYARANRNMVQLFGNPMVPRALFYRLPSSRPKVRLPIPVSWF